MEGKGEKVKQKRRKTCKGEIRKKRRKKRGPNRTAGGKGGIGSDETKRMKEEAVKNIGT